MTKEEAYIKFWNARYLDIVNKVNIMMEEEVKDGASDSPSVRISCLYAVLSKIENLDKTTFYAGWDAANDLGS